MRLKTLNGAPPAHHLTFDEDVLLARHQCMSFSDCPSSVRSILKWRCINSRQARLHSGWSQPYLPHSNPPSLPKASFHFEQDTTCHDTALGTADDFLQHSLIFHDTLLSSQVELAQDTRADQTVSSSSFLTTSFDSSTSEPSSPLAVGKQGSDLQLPPSLAVTTLGAIPSAQHLCAIYPQTPTPNIVCVLMTNPERRDIFVRKGGYKMDLHEMTVADDTRSGFKISFWLRPSNETSFAQVNPQHRLLHTLQHIGVGDIVLLRNIALTSFRDTVHGQSLNPQISRARTTIDVLESRNGRAVNQPTNLPAPILAALKRLQRWSKSYIAVTETRSKRTIDASDSLQKSGKRRFAGSLCDDTLPPDTLEPA
ncbi:hypothetical protein FB567DRAFT_168127 [Paraphoma chrysanthemicola]|uniref:Uncharacterized protein n=1 Tax=Paraphoma chrysanthemicola TaxID=798071 RepID=A0A8K0REQ5_9PLEO|nr:hypothetical protein FB567DRAFT_168127 [Paraphoma chrysanthemicola]